ncbi:hypothetical protein I6F21_25875 [Bradyrhizobium sp. NBAIM03]|uniref:hypothetical protein n=1 Tax=Bradyrhizobium sp. NBAIM03 TaxID=2793816 RepID=UPI001CD7A2A0|nr:hypothetical protein [Bradyrhizobium sp. NBAIM03]MCA1535968.1 hypothetical protein [Bradyrhizobium sp. NBAIM03]
MLVTVAKKMPGVLTRQIASWMLARLDIHPVENLMFEPEAGRTIELTIDDGSIEGSSTKVIHENGRVAI